MGKSQVCSKPLWRQQFIRASINAWNTIFNFPRKYQLRINANSGLKTHRICLPMDSICTSNLNILLRWREEAQLAIQPASALEVPGGEKGNEPRREPHREVSRRSRGETGWLSRLDTRMQIQGGVPILDKGTDSPGGKGTRKWSSGTWQRNTWILDLSIIRPPWEWWLSAPALEMHKTPNVRSWRCDSEHETWPLASLWPTCKWSVMMPLYCYYY